MTPKALAASILVLALTAAPAWAQVGSTGHGGVGDKAPPKGGLQYDPNDTRNPISIAIAAYDRGDYARAADMFEEALSATPEDPDLLTYKAMAYEGRKNFIGARQLLLHAVRVDRDNVDAHRELGLTYAALRDAKGLQGELNWLKAKAAACPAKCDNPDKVKRAVDAVEAAANPAAPKAG
jgi:tetratricopeptide (TPR) repeat protein